MPRAAPVTTATLPACVLYIFQPLGPRPSDTGDLAFNGARWALQQRTANWNSGTWRSKSLNITPGLVRLDIVGTVELCVGPSP